MYLLPKEPTLLRPLAIAGLVLIGLGIAGLVLGQFSYTTEKTVIDVGAITASVDEKHSVDVPEMAGIAAILTVQQIATTVGVVYGEADVAQQSLSACTPDPGGGCLQEDRGGAP